VEVEEDKRERELERYVEKRERGIEGKRKKGKQRVKRKWVEEEKKRRKWWTKMELKKKVEEIMRNRDERRDNVVEKGEMWKRRKRAFKRRVEKNNEG